MGHAHVRLEAMLARSGGRYAVTPGCRHPWIAPALEHWFKIARKDEAVGGWVGTRACVDRLVLGQGHKRAPSGVVRALSKSPCLQDSHQTVTEAMHDNRLFTGGKLEVVLTPLVWPLPPLKGEQQEGGEQREQEGGEDVHPWLGGALKRWIGAGKGAGKGSDTPAAPEPSEEEVVDGVRSYETELRRRKGKPMPWPSPYKDGVRRCALATSALPRGTFDLAVNSSTGASVVRPFAESRVPGLGLALHAGSSTHACAQVHAAPSSWST